MAQIGSVIGRGFSYGLLRDVAGLDDAPLQAALEKLADADIVLVQGAPRTRTILRSLPPATIAAVGLYPTAATAHRAFRGTAAGD